LENAAALECRSSLAERERKLNVKKMLIAASLLAVVVAVYDAKAQQNPLNAGRFSGGYTVAQTRALADDLPAPSIEVAHKLVGLRTELAAAENSLKSSRASNWFGIWDAAIAQTQAHIRDLKNQIAALEEPTPTGADATARGADPTDTGLSAGPRATSQLPPVVPTN
jgi:hypothetical protein